MCTLCHVGDCGFSISSRRSLESSALPNLCLPSTRTRNCIGRRSRLIATFRVSAPVRKSAVQRLVPKTVRRGPKTQPKLNYQHPRLTCTSLIARVPRQLEGWYPNYIEDLPDTKGGIPIFAGQPEQFENWMWKVD